jgi:RNA polymerase sigma factor (sigma-70 family)
VSDFAGAADDASEMNELTDSELLRAFAREGDETAFTEFVRRHAGLVYGAALRRTGDHGMAEEAAQNVFVLLAQRAAALTDHPAPAAWLQKTAAFQAIRVAEKELNRRRTMKRFAQENFPPGDAGNDPWKMALPLLDEAVASLPEADRRVVVMRYWQRMPFRGIAAALGGTVEAWEKRAERALTKLSRLLQRRGVVMSTAVLAAGLTPHVSQAAVPAGVLAKFAPAALSASQTAGTAGWLTILAMNTKLTLTAGAAALLLLCGTGGWLAGRASATHSAPSPQQKVLEQIAAGAPQRESPLAQPHTASLRALLAAAERDLLVSGYDPAAKANAAARIAGIAPEDIREALAIASGMSGLRDELTALLLQHWANTEPAEACAYAVKLKLPSMGLPPLADPLKVWAARDPRAALTWLRSHSGADNTDTKPGGWRPISSLRWIFGAWALQDMPAAVAEFKQLKEPHEIDGAITGMMESAAGATGRGEMLSAILAVKSTGSGRDVWHEISRVMERWGTVRPAELAAWLDAQDVPKPSHGSMGKSVLKGWLQSDPSAAVQWWLNAPGGYPDKAYRMDDVVEAWSQFDVFAAAEWLTQQPLDEHAANGMSTLSQKLASSDPERALAWAEKIPVEVHRDSAVESVMKAWAQKDRPAALAAMEASALPAALKAGVMEKLNTKQP